MLLRTGLLPGAWLKLKRLLPKLSPLLTPARAHTTYSTFTQPAASRNGGHYVFPAMKCSA